MGKGEMGEGKEKEGKVRERSCRTNVKMLPSYAPGKVHETTTLLLVIFAKYSPIEKKSTHRLSNNIWLLTTPPHLQYVATLPYR